MSDHNSYEDKDAVREKVSQAGWNVDWNTWDCLSSYEKSFFEFEFSGVRTFEYYQHRLSAIEFSGMGSVLDVACGMGQWSAALASLNQRVCGVDVNVGRLLFAYNLAHSMGYPETRFVNASMEAMSFPDESFDGIFCYGSFMFARMDKTLDEFYRILKKGGRAYFNVNATGWYAHLLIDRGIKKKNFSMVRTALSMIARTIIGKTGNIVVRKSWIEGLLHARGFRIVASDIEGTINMNPSCTLPPPGYPPSFYGMPSILEYVIEKQ